MSFNWGPVVGSLGGALLGGLFGGQNPTNQYAPALSQQADLLANDASQEGLLASAGQAGYNQFSPGYQQAVTSDANYLGTDPYTDQYGTQILGGLTKNVNADYNSAIGSVSQQMARRGLSGGGLEAGTDAAIAAARAGDIAGAQNTLAGQEIANQGQRQGELVNLLGGVTNNYENDAAKGLAAQAGDNSEIAGIYQNLNASANAEANAQNNATNASIAGLAGAIGAGFGKSNGGGDTNSSKAITLPGTNVTGGPNFYPSGGAPLSNSTYGGALASGALGGGGTLSSGDPTGGGDTVVIPDDGTTTRAQRVNPALAFLSGMGSNRNRGLGLG